MTGTYSTDKHNLDLSHLEFERRREVVSTERSIPTTCLADAGIDSE